VAHEASVKRGRMKKDLVEINSPIQHQLADLIGFYGGNTPRIFFFFFSQRSNLTREE
jgi:hypothetical protein